jgi:hypothetical protein
MCYKLLILLLPYFVIFHPPYTMHHPSGFWVLDNLSNPFKNKLVELFCKGCTERSTNLLNIDRLKLSYVDNNKKIFIFKDKNYKKKHFFNNNRRKIKKWC